MKDVIKLLNIKRKFLLKLSKKVLDDAKLVDSLAEDNIRNEQWFINWLDKLNEISVK